MNYNNLSIDDIELSVRSRNALHRAGIHTVGAMLELNEEKLFSINNLGAKSVEEIQQKIIYYSEAKTIKVKAVSKDLSDDEFREWLNDETSKKYVMSFLQEKDIKVDALDMLSVRSYNLLIYNGFIHVHKIIFMSIDEICKIPRIDISHASEIKNKCDTYLLSVKSEILNTLPSLEEVQNSKPETLSDMIHNKDYHDIILEYVKINDLDIEKMHFHSNKPVIQLSKLGYNKMSDIIFLTKQSFLDLKGMGAGTVNEIFDAISAYINKHEHSILAFVNGDRSDLLSDESIENMILSFYEKTPFKGLSFNDFREKVGNFDVVSDERLKKVIGSLLAEGKFEYVDYRCYRVYEKYTSCVKECTEIKEREKDILLKILSGKTLEEVAADYGVTRERTRQIVEKADSRLRKWYNLEKHEKYFDEDYYAYFFENYNFDKSTAFDGLGISEEIYKLFKIKSSERGKKELEAALSDTENLDVGLRIRIKNYLNRNKINIDGEWIELKRGDIEDFVIRRYCSEEKTFDEFTQLYNRLLSDEGIPFDEKIYYSEDIARTRKNRLSESRNLLWKQNEKLRYYEIDANDYSELIETIGIPFMENTELSTLKLFSDYPEIMRRYDIRDHYELHNLLRKVISAGSYHDFKCERTPMLRFGEFDRDSALIELLKENSPISYDEMISVICAEYGYDKGVTIASYVKPLSVYFHNGYYCYEQKVMSDEDKEILKSALTKEFYYFGEIRKIYSEIKPEADIEEINGYNLKTMGYTVLSKYIITSGITFDEFIEKELTSGNVIDVLSLRMRYSLTNTFNCKLYDLKSNLDIIEVEPDKYFNFKVLEKSGVSKDDFYKFRDDVYDFVDDGDYFTIKSLVFDGFNSDLFNFGFSDMFYASLLRGDDRFSLVKAFGTLLIYCGNSVVSAGAFAESIIKKELCIDVFDLMTLLEERHGCKIGDKWDVLGKLQGTGIYHDRILDRLYASVEDYYRDLEETGD